MIIPERISFSSPRIFTFHWIKRKINKFGNWYIHIVNQICHECEYVLFILLWVHYNHCRNKLLFFFFFVWSLHGCCSLFRINSLGQFVICDKYALFLLFFRYLCLLPSFSVFCCLSLSLSLSFFRFLSFSIAN